MANQARNRTTHNLESAARNTRSIAEKSAVGLFKWATTDHLIATNRLSRMPKMGFFRSIWYLFTQFILAMFMAVLAGYLTFLLIAYGIPFLITGSI